MHFLLNRLLVGSCGRREWQGCEVELFNFRGENATECIRDMLYLGLCEGRVEGKREAAIGRILRAT